MVRGVTHWSPTLSKALAIEIQQLGSTLEGRRLLGALEPFGKRWSEPNYIEVVALNICSILIPFVV
jgi:hypothetical protein